MAFPPGRGLGTSPEHAFWGLMACALSMLSLNGPGVVLCQFSKDVSKTISD